MTRIQRKLILAITKAYRTTSNFKLHQLLGVLGINQELRLNIEYEERPKEEKRERYLQMMTDEGQTHQEIQETETRELLWFMAGHGPHRAYLKRFGIEETDSCRLCETDAAETPLHLMTECAATRSMMPANENDPTQAEEAIVAVVHAIYKKRRELEMTNE